VLLIVALLIVVVGTVAWFWRGEIAIRLATREIDRLAAAADPAAGLADGLHVGLCGTGSPMTDARHGGPCTAVIAGRKMFIVDAGSGSAASLNRMRLNPARIEAVLITHYHSDHIAGLGDLLMQHWVAASSKTPLPVYGPPGLGQVLDGTRVAFELDNGYRTAHHGERIAPTSGRGAEAREFVPAQDGRVVLIETPDLVVTAFLVDHGPIRPAVGYRFDYKGRSVVLSGDTKASPAVERESRDADLLIHEALSPRLLALLESGFARHARSTYAQVMLDIRNYHTSPAEAADIAQRAGVRMLVFNHIVPPLPSDLLEPAFLDDARERYKGPLHVGRDGDFFSLPAGSRSIETGARP
jgi:ribonuclease Z